MEESNGLNYLYKILDGIFFDNMEETYNYILCSSKTMEDQYWNIAYIKNVLNKDILNELETKFKNMNRINSLYLGRGNECYEFNKKLLIENGYNLDDSDCFMCLDKNNGVDVNIDIKIARTEEEYNDFMKVVSSAYNDTTESSEENVYAGAITECYYNAIKSTMGSDEHLHIIAYDKGIPVSAANFNYKNGIGEIDCVGTMQGYWNRGYAKQVISFIMKEFEKMNGKLLFLCTEYHSKNQEFYEKLGFKEMFVLELYTK